MKGFGYVMTWLLPGGARPVTELGREPRRGGAPRADAGQLARLMPGKTSTLSAVGSTVGPADQLIAIRRPPCGAKSMTAFGVGYAPTGWGDEQLPEIISRDRGFLP
jgi:hypothetical protein